MEDKQIIHFEPEKYVITENVRPIQGVRSIQVGPDADTTFYERWAGDSGGQLWTVDGARIIERRIAFSIYQIPEGYVDDPNHDEILMTLVWSNEEAARGFSVAPKLYISKTERFLPR